MTQKKWSVSLLIRSTNFFGVRGKWRTKYRVGDEKQTLRRGLAGGLPDDEFGVQENLTVG